MTHRRFAFTAPLLLLVLAGCDGPESKIREEFLLDEKPEGSQTVVEIRDALLAGDAPSEPQAVAVVGQIGGMPNPFGDEAQPDFPWRAGESTFFLVDPTTVAQFGDHGHADGEECSFCLAKARSFAGTVAFVSFSEGGKPILVQADELLGLTEGMTVTVVGKASMVAEMLLIDATGVYAGE